MQCDTEEHLLYTFEHLACIALDDIAFQQQVESGEVQEFIAVRLHEVGRLVDFLFAVVLKDVIAVEPFFCHVSYFLIEGLEPQFLFQPTDFLFRSVRKDACGNHFPCRSLGCRQFHRRLDECVDGVSVRHPRLAEAGELLLKCHHAVRPFTVFACHTVQDISQLAVVCRPDNVVDGLPLFVALIAEEDVILRFIVMPVLHETFLHPVLYVLDGAQPGVVCNELLYFTDHSGYLVVCNLLSGTDETLFNGY